MNVRNLKIEHRICINNLGKTDDEYAAEYVKKLTVALQSEYPDADVDVNLNSDFANVSQTFISGESDPEDGDVLHDIKLSVNETSNYVWERM